jgi:hypothetical protein
MTSHFNILHFNSLFQKLISSNYVNTSLVIITNWTTGDRFLEWTYVPSAFPPSFPSSGKLRGLLPLVQNLFTHYHIVSRLRMGLNVPLCDARLKQWNSFSSTSVSKFNTIQSENTSTQVRILHFKNSYALFRQMLWYPRSAVLCKKHRFYTSPAVRIQICAHFLPDVHNVKTPNNNYKKKHVLIGHMALVGILNSTHIYFTNFPVQAQDVNQQQGFNSSQPL